MSQTSIRDTLTEQLKLLAERNKQLCTHMTEYSYDTSSGDDEVVDAHAAQICEIARLLASMDGGSI